MVGPGMVGPGMVGPGMGMVGAVIRALDQNPIAKMAKREDSGKRTCTVLAGGLTRWVGGLLVSTAHDSQDDQTGLGRWLVAVIGYLNARYWPQTAHSSSSSSS